MTSRLGKGKQRNIFLRCIYNKSFPFFCRFRARNREKKAHKIQCTNITTRRISCWFTAVEKVAKNACRQRVVLYLSTGLYHQVVKALNLYGVKKRCTLYKKPMQIIDAYIFVKQIKGFHEGKNRTAFAGFGFIWTEITGRPKNATGQFPCGAPNHSKPVG